jgi:hypothetical protein
LKPTCRQTADPLSDVPTGRRLLAAPKAAAEFRNWLANHGLDDRMWTIDDIWFLATEDFAVAQSITLPSRNTFLGALQKTMGVRVQYDKRVPMGSRKKTTVYTFAPLVRDALVTETATLALDFECE